MPNASQRKQPYADFYNGGQDWSPYSQCGCDRQAHFAYPHAPKLRVYHEDAILTFHLPECSTHGSLRPKNSKFIDPDVDPNRDPYECCISDNDEDSGGSVTAARRTICVVYEGHEPSYHFQNCVYAEAEMKARMRRNDKKIKEQKRRIRLMKAQLRQQELDLGMANEPKRQPEKRKRGASESPEPTFYAISGFVCDPESENDDTIAPGNLVPVYDDQSTIPATHLHDRDAYNLASRAQPTHTRRPVLVDKANDSYAHPATSDRQYDPRTIASDVLAAMGFDRDVLSSPEPQTKKRRVEETSDGVEGQEYSQFTPANTSLDQRG